MLRLAFPRQGLHLARNNLFKSFSASRSYLTKSGIEIPETMKAAVYEGPRNINCRIVPTPKLTNPDDAIIRSISSAICGTELHFYRGDLSTSTGHIMGHETVGEVVDVGENVKGFKPGDKVISCFTTQCGKCWYCVRGYSSKCSNTAVFGTTALNGGQAQFVRIPQAESTLFHMPPELDPKVALLMCDIFPTGYFCVSNYTKKFPQKRIEESVAIQFGLGPVGQCALASAKELGIKKLFAVDSVESRLEVAEKFGAIPLTLGKDNIKQIILDATDNRGADVVFEIVGNKEALGMAFDVVRPFGYISSIGYHHEALPFSGLDCYMKNVTLQFGRCPAWSLFPEALPLLVKNQHLFKDFIDTKIEIENISEGYNIFDKHLVRKVVCDHHYHP